MTQSIRPRNRDRKGTSLKTFSVSRRKIFPYVFQFRGSTPSWYEGSRWKSFLYLGTWSEKRRQGRVINVNTNTHIYTCHRIFTVRGNTFLVTTRPGSVLQDPSPKGTSTTQTQETPNGFRRIRVFPSSVHISVHVTTNRESIPALDRRGPRLFTDRPRDCRLSQILPLRTFSVLTSHRLVQESGWSPFPTEVGRDTNHHWPTSRETWKILGRPEVVIQVDGLIPFIKS